MEQNIIKERLRKLRRLLRSRRLDALVVTSEPNVSYLTGFMGADSRALITPRLSYLITDSRYTEQAQQECVACKIIQRTGTLAEAIARIVSRSKSVKTIGVENNCSLAEFDELRKLLSARLKKVAPPVDIIRAVKDPREIKTLRESLEIARKALGRALKYVKPGITECELAARIDFEICRRGAATSFETIVAFGPNASRPHHKPGGRKLKKRDTILIDFGARYRLYGCDLTRCFAIGRPTRSYIRAYRAVREAQQAAIRLVTHRARLADVDAAARQTLAENDLPVYGHGTGHGLGLEIHERPRLTAKAKGRLQAGNVITIEPGVYIPGKLGIRLEEDVLVTEHGYEVLSRGIFEPTQDVPVIG